MTNDVAERLKRAIDELEETSLERDALAEIERLGSALRRIIAMFDTPADRNISSTDLAADMYDCAEAALKGSAVEPTAELHASENRCVECYSYRQSGATECRNCGLKF